MNDLRRWSVRFFGLALLIVIVSGCATEQSPADEEAADGSSSDPMMEELREEKARETAGGEFLADAYVKRGRAHFGAGRLEEALKAFGEALEIAPDHEEARREYNRVQATLGERSGDLATAFDDARTQRMIKIQQARAAVEAHWRKGLALQAEGEHDAAIEEYRRAALIQSLYEYEVAFTPTPEGLQAQIERAQAERDDAVRARVAREIQEANKVAQEAERKAHAEQQGRILMLFRDATTAFNAGRYGEAENYANEVLRLEPRNGEALELQDLARRSRLSAEDDRIRRVNAEEWKKTFEAFKAATLPQVQDVIWGDWAARHGGASTSGTETAVASGLSPRDQEIMNALQSTRIGLEFEETALTEALDHLSKLTGINILLDPKIAGDTDASITQLQVDSITVKDALDLIASFVDLKWKISGGVVQMTNAEGLLSNAILRLYDVKDLVTPIQDFPGDEINLTPSGGDSLFDENDFDDPVPPFEEDALVELIQTSVAPESWDAEGVGIESRGGTLIVRQAPEIHGHINRLLSDLRSNGGLQVAIETRFITVSDNFLQDVGVDLRGLGDQTGGAGVGGKGSFEPFDDVFAGSPSNPQGAGTSNDSGVFFNDNSDGDARARMENLFDVALGAPGVLTNSGGTSLQFAYLDDIQLEAILRAVQKTERTEIVVAPKVTVYNNERANVTVLNQVSYIYDFDVEIAQLSQVGDPLVQTVRDGVILDVRPIISADRRFVTLELRPTVATLVRPIQTFSTTLAQGPPVIIQLPELKIQRVRTTVTMPDQGTLMLGGLKYLDEQRLESTAPWIDKIPVLNFFFKRQGTFVNRRNLIILIKAKIIDLSESMPTNGPR